MGPPGGDSSSARQEGWCLGSPSIAVDGARLPPGAASLGRVEAC